jgi:Cu/Ag efflux protein CusF
VRRAAFLVGLSVLLALGCGDSPREKPLSEPGERLYDVRGRIEGRDASDNLVRLKHERIPGFMEAMTMEFTVRGADVTSLPPDGAEVDAKLHVTDRAYWLTDVRSR